MNTQDKEEIRTLIREELGKYYSCRLERRGNFPHEPETLAQYLPAGEIMTLDQMKKRNVRLKKDFQEYLKGWKSKKLSKPATRTD
jgi:hypothetical protein